MPPEENSIGAMAEQPGATLEQFASPAAAPEPERSSFFSRIFTAETGPGPISDYKGHVLDFTGDESGARIARGLTGIFDNALNLAIIDILIGVVKLAWPKLMKPKVMPNATA